MGLRRLSAGSVSIAAVCAFAVACGNSSSGGSSSDEGGASGADIGPDEGSGGTSSGGTGDPFGAGGTQGGGNGNASGADAGGGGAGNVAGRDASGGDTAAGAAGAPASTGADAGSSASGTAGTSAAGTSNAAGTAGTAGFSGGLGSAGLAGATAGGGGAAGTGVAGSAGATASEFCESCASDAECAAGVGPGALCVSIGGARACAMDCSAAACPDPRMVCTQLRPSVFQCLPASGDCTCLPATDGATRPCAVTNEFGSCLGVSTCDAASGFGPCSAATPAEDICDGADNDCDGTPDDPFIDGTVTYTEPDGTTGLLLGDDCGLGPCGGGEVVCTSDGTALTCTTAANATPEACNGADDDCDGSSDEDFPELGDACDGADSDACANGTFTCNGSGTDVECVNETAQNLLDLCNGVDDDCNPLTADGADEALLGTPCDTGLDGICAAGTWQCDGGPALSCAQSEPAVYEICGNGEDDNCDGNVDESIDEDGDGWGHCDGDCCDLAGVCGDTPELVNPGAFEVLGNSVDDDCDPGTSDTDAPPPCSTAQDFTVTPANLAQAMELCQFTTTSPPLPQRKWGVISAEFRLANGTTPSAAQLSNMQNSQAAVLVNYGNVIVPQLGPTMAGLSNGMMRDAGDPGYPGTPSTSFGTSSQPPAAYLAAHAGQLPSSSSCMGTCPAGSGANDPVNLRLTIRVPTNARSFAYQFRFFSREYWVYACSAYNDFYLTQLTTGAAGIPADKNISFDSLNNPVSVNNGFFEVCVPHNCYTCPNGPSELAGTGMETSNWGGGTVWLQTTAPVVPGETMTIEFMVFDVSDTILDSLALLDAFEWSTDASGVGTGPPG